MSVSDYLEREQVPFETIVHPPAFSAQKLAKYLHLPGKQVAKNVLLARPDGYLIAVLPATRHVDTARLSVSWGEPLRLATDDEISAVFSNCEWGVVPPFGRLYGLPMVLDDSLNPDDLLVFEGTTHFEAIRMRCRDFERLERPRRLRFAS